MPYKPSIGNIEHPQGWLPDMVDNPHPKSAKAIETVRTYLRKDVRLLQSGESGVSVRQKFVAVA